MTDVAILTTEPSGSKVRGAFYPLQKAELLTLKAAKLINNTTYVHFFRPKPKSDFETSENKLSPTTDASNSSHFHTLRNNSNLSAKEEGENFNFDTAADTLSTLIFEEVLERKEYQGHQYFKKNRTYYYRLDYKGLSKLITEAIDSSNIVNPGGEE